MITPAATAAGRAATTERSRRRAEAVLAATRRGLSAREIGYDLGITERQVCRLRALLRAEGRL